MLILSHPRNTALRMHVVQLEKLLLIPRGPNVVVHCVKVQPLREIWNVKVNSCFVDNFSGVNAKSV